MANYTTGAANAKQLQGITVSPTAPNSGQNLQYNGTQWAPTNNNGQILAITYNNSQSGPYSSTSNTLVDVDATNMAITFIVPPSGNVLIELEALSQTDATADQAQWGLREATTNVAGPTVAQYTEFTAGGNNDLKRIHMSIYITGLTPGASHTYKWAFANSPGGANHNVYIYAKSDTTGPAVMKVTACV